MNKTKYFKLIDQLRSNIRKDLGQHPNICLYVKTWVIGGLNQLEAKAKGKIIYPYNATYSYLLKDFLDAFYCRNINEQIKDETIKYLITNDNMQMVNQLSVLINK